MVREVKFFLGHAGFYGHFVKDFSKNPRPLCNLPAKDVSFFFDDLYLESFEKLKQLLPHHPSLSPHTRTYLLSLRMMHLIIQ